MERGEGRKEKKRKRMRMKDRERVIHTTTRLSADIASKIVYHNLGSTTSIVEGISATKAVSSTSDDGNLAVKTKLRHRLRKSERERKGGKEKNGNDRKGQEPVERNRHGSKLLVEGCFQLLVGWWERERRVGDRGREGERERDGEREIANTSHQNGRRRGQDRLDMTLGLLISACFIRS